VGTWAARTSWHTAQGRESSGQSISYIRNMLLCAVALTALLVIGEVEQNPGRGVEVDNTLQVLCSGCERNLKSGTQCDVWTLIPRLLWKRQGPNGGQWEVELC
jgi:hypothetical protein